MSIAIGGNSASKIYLGTDEVERMYMGSNLVYGSAPVPLPYDSEIEYLETDGAAYIDTGIAPSSITPIFEIRAYKPSWSGNTSYYPFGSDGSGNTRFSIAFLWGNRIEFRIGGYKNVGSKTANWYTIKLDGSNGEAYLNGTLQWTSTTSPLTFNTYSIRIFTRSGSTGDNTAILTGVRVSSYKLWNGSTLLQDMIPVRIGQVGFLYNKVDGTFFGNAADSGAFVLGNDIT